MKNTRLSTRGRGIPMDVARGKDVLNIKINRGTGAADYRSERSVTEGGTLHLLNGQSYSPKIVQVAWLGLGALIMLLAFIPNASWTASLAAVHLYISSRG